jgi:hypothetical protein
MSKKYPTTYREYEKHVAKGQTPPDENNHLSQGGSENLPQGYDSADEASEYGAKGWSGDQSVFE